MTLLRPENVAEILNCSVSQVYAIKRKIGFCKIGGMVRFRPEDVEQFISRNMVADAGPRTAPPPKNGRPFKHLDGERLLDSWRRQGVQIDQPNGRSVHSSGS